MGDLEIEPDCKTVPELGRAGDLSRGWVAAPLIQMSQRILGVTPAEAGFARANIQPQLCALSWARGKVPLPNGDAIEVEWREQDRNFELILNSPVPASVTLPFDSTQILHATANGRPLNLAPGSKPWTVSPGKLHVVLTQK